MKEEGPRAQNFNILRLEETKYETKYNASDY